MTNMDFGISDIYSAEKNEETKLLSGNFMMKKLAEIF